MTWSIFKNINVKIYCKGWANINYPKILYIPLKTYVRYYTYVNSFKRGNKDNLNCIYIYLFIF